MYSVLAWFGSTFAARVMTSLGLSIISYASVIVAFNALISQSQTQYSNMSSITLNILSLSGMPESLGLVVGAMLAKLTINASKKIGFTQS